mmetsp:Transcript_148244/g.385297  ORF Transcript_148244/g.385297 Transcript_148244/m.385297 type:complete len:774 (-) Transcript_148244:71-2392(-)
MEADISADGWGEDISLELAVGDEEPLASNSMGADEVGGLQARVRDLEAQLRESEEARQRDKEEMENRMQELRQKTKEHVKQLQEKMQQVVKQKDQKLQDLEAEKEELASRICATGGQAQDGSANDLCDTLQTKNAALEAELAALKSSRAALAEDEDTEQPQMPLEAADANSEEVAALRSQLGEKAQEAQEELNRLRQEHEKKIADVVMKAKEHVKQVQSRLENSIAENRELTEKCAETESAYHQQQEKVQKYQQLMAQAKSRIDDYEQRERELREALGKSQSQRFSLQEQMGSMEKAYAVPPTKQEISDRGGILLAVEAENDDVWCLVRTGSKEGATDSADTDEGAGSEPKSCWWLLSQLDVEDQPVPIQRRWKGEVSALRAQLQRFKKKSDDIQEEFNSYRSKANTALTTNASQIEEIQKKDRQVEELGEQLHSMSAELQRVTTERDRALDDIAEGKRRLQEAHRETRDLDRALDRRTREWEDRCESEVNACRKALQAEMSALEQNWLDKERALQKELDLKRSMKDSLEEEVESLRARLTKQEAAAAAAAAEAAAAAAASQVARDVGRSPPPDGEDNAVGQGSLALPVGGSGGDQLAGKAMSPPSPSPEASAVGTPRDGSDANLPQSTAEEPRPSQHQVLPAQAYSLQASVAWQDLVALRSQVRQLEVNLQEERSQHNSSRKEVDMARSELKEMTMQQRLQNTVGQHQQMEYIRNVFKRFVETLPPGSKEQEQLIPVLMTFFKFPDEEARLINTRRAGSKASGLWGAFGLRS